MEYQGVHVLLVEDNPINQEVTCHILESIGFKTSIADNGQKALDMVSAMEYDLIIMDVQMPVMDGLKATRAIREMPDRREVPILAMTANAFEGDREPSLRAGMNHHLAKPVEPEQLFKSLLEWLPPQKKRPREEEMKIEPSSLQRDQEKPIDEEYLEVIAKLQSIDGLDLSVGLDSLQGDVKSYTCLLGHFSQRYGGKGDVLLQYLEAGDFDSLERLKGERR